MIQNPQWFRGIDRVPKKIKGLKKLMSKNQTPEPVAKGILRARHGLPVFRDGTIRFDMSDVPVTHFTPEEVEVEWSQLKHLGYTHDCFGEELVSNTQMLEIFPQDFILAKNGAEYFIRAAKYIDDLLVKFYGMEPFYHVDKPSDLVGHLICALAPHTSGGVLSRLIGFADCSGGYAHPLFHAAKRRNCDGDEDAIMLLMDGLLNFSREILPSNRGGQMDAPLVLTTRLNPTEVDKEALNVDSAWHYERWFYEATLEQPHPKTLADRGSSAFGVRKAEGEMCNGNLALTVTEGAVRKYIKVTKHVMETYGVDHYTKQNVEWLADSVESLFNNDKAKQMSLADFL